MKWSSSHMMAFMPLLEAYVPLWNIRCKEYTNVSLKEILYRKLQNEVNEMGLGFFEMKQLKARVKSLKDAFRQELNKVEKSKKSGCSSDEVYVPKLAWFRSALFLAEVVCTRETSSNLNFEAATLSSNVTVSEEESLIQETQDTFLSSVTVSEEESLIKETQDTFLSSVMVSEEESLIKESQDTSMCGTPNSSLMFQTTNGSTIQRKAKKRCRTEEGPSDELKLAIKQLDNIAKNAKTESLDFEHWAKSVAQKFRLMPRENALKMQNTIDNLIYKEELNLLQKRSEAP